MYGNANECQFKASGERGKKLRETIEWNNVYASQCEACREIYGEKKEEPPCDTCKPKVIEENVQAIKIFYLTRNQLIMTMNGPIDIMHEPIYRAMDLHEVKNKKECFHKILFMAHDWLGSIKKDK